MLMKLICSVSSNQSHGEFPDCRSQRASGGEASLLVSPLVVAGIVIGLVLFLSCVTIIVGSMRKDGRLRNPQLSATYGPDDISLAGSAADVRSGCLEHLPPALDFASFTETMSPVSSLYPAAPPPYDECVGARSADAYLPAEDPPPYSLLDPCRVVQGAELGHTHTEAEISASAAHVASISLPEEAAPPYEAVQPLPLVPCDLYKHQWQRSDDGRLQRLLLDG